MRKILLVFAVCVCSAVFAENTLQTALFRAGRGA